MGCPPLCSIPSQLKNAAIQVPCLELLIDFIGDLSCLFCLGRVRPFFLSSVRLQGIDNHLEIIAAEFYDVVFYFVSSLSITSCVMASCRLAYTATTLF